ncbi:flexible cuticle protein 12-like [Pogonomyrmex barbatus]|uniref:Flexible cuticle protein 12-like n=1 Tax=Pogonomyrmex barbatus TaxID=144034 RepID=A0A6I9VWS7_9HYME|nr:flexible cuticle protein 12-like [Pogonomyrmex barbatus]
MLSQCTRSFQVTARKNKIYLFFDMNPLIIALCALVATTVAAPLDDTTPIPILKQALDGPNPDGSYNYSYETGNGIQAQEEGHLNNVGTDSEALEARGSFSFTDANGQTYQILYVANENGFQPEGAHLPTAPPVPAHILKALQYIAEHPEEDEKH